MGVDREGLRPEGRVHPDIRGLAPDAGQFDERVTVGGDLSAMIASQNFIEGDAILCLRIAPPDRPEVVLEPRLAAVGHMLRPLRRFAQFARCIVYPNSGRPNRTGVVWGKSMSI